MLACFPALQNLCRFSMYNNLIFIGNLWTKYNRPVIKMTCLFIESQEKSQYRFEK